MPLGLDLYQKLYLVRQTTQAIRREYPSDQIKTPVHLSMGEEAIAVGICHALGQQAQFCGTYRNHGLYLSLTSETDKFFAELYGKQTGTAGGKAGSMHLTAPEAGLMATSAIVGTTIPIAVGMAFANEAQDDDRIVVVFFGDGALDEGVFWESFNAACLWQLPIIFVCEDNGLAPHTTTKERQGYSSITAVLSHYNAIVFQEKTTDVEFIYRLACKSNYLARHHKSPIFLHLQYYRYLEHVGVNEDFDQGYRTRKEFQEWHKIDPVNFQKDRLIKRGLGEAVALIEIKVQEQIEKSIMLAKDAPFPEKADLFREVWA